MKKNFWEKMTIKMSQKKLYADKKIKKEIEKCTRHNRSHYQ